jgi:FlaA1/EpsC-like NDP-sugar epimerase
MKNESCLQSCKTNSQRGRKMSRDVVFLIGDLLPVLDFIGVLIAACVATVIYLGLSSNGFSYDSVWHDSLRAAIGVAILAPLILYDRRFVVYASESLAGSMVWCYSVRILLLMAVIMLSGLGRRYVQVMPINWIMMWIISVLVATGTTRILLVRSLRRLERIGVLSESIAIVGRGDIADRLIATLRRTRGASVDIVGVFDDEISRQDPSADVPTGSVDDLLELGKSQVLDWIVLTIPANAYDRVPSLIHRLKALSVPVGLCPRSFQEWEPRRLLLRPGPQLKPRLLLPSTAATPPMVLPPWIVTMLGLPLLAYREQRARIKGFIRHRRRRIR